MKNMNNKKKTKIMIAIAIWLACVELMCIGIYVFVNTNQENMGQYTLYYKARFKSITGDYNAAAALLLYCQDFRDSKSLREKYSYRAGKKCLKNGEYSEAIQHFLVSYKYSDSPERIKEANYLHGCDELEASNYGRAVDFFKLAKDYKDTLEKKSEAQYAYVLASPSMSNSRTREYIEDLVAVNYKDSKQIYEKLSELTVVIDEVNYDAESSLNDYDTLENSKTIYFHFHISCGIPDKPYTLKARVQFPGSDPFEEELTASLGEYWYCYYDSYFMNGATGDATFTILDENNNPLAERTITLIN